jgi:DNA modification methylase
LICYNFTTIFYNEKNIDDEGISADDYVDWFIPYCIEIERVIKPTGSSLI